MPALVTEDWSQYEFIRGERARRHFYITGVADALEAESALLNQKGVAQFASHELDGSLGASQPRFSHPKGPHYWEADVEYAPADQLTPGGGGDLLALPIRWQWRSAPRDESTDIDAKGRPILNTAGHPWQSDFTNQFSGHILSARRWESSYRSGVADDYSNAVNLNQVSVARIGIFAPGRLKLLSYEPEDEYTSVGTDPIPCAYTFEVRAGAKRDSDGLWDGFKFRIRSEGFMGWYESTKQGKFVNSKGVEVSEPVLLDRTGKPLDTDIKVQVSPGSTEDPVACPYADLLFPDDLIETAVNGVVFLKYLKGKPLNYNGLALFT